MASENLLDFKKREALLDGFQGLESQGFTAHDVFLYTHYLLMREAAVSEYEHSIPLAEAKKVASERNAEAVVAAAHRLFPKESANAS